MKRDLLLLCLLIFAFQAQAQNLQLGGLQDDKMLILTPSPTENQKLMGKNPYQVEFLGIKPHTEERVPFEFSPTLPKEWKERYVKINFLGANQIAKVYLNGKYVGKHVGGYTDFHFGLNEFINWDKPNVLAVKVDNRFDFDVPPHSADYNFQGGIYREVELYVWHPFFIKDIHIKTPQVNY